MSRGAMEMRSGLLAYLQDYGRTNGTGLAAIAAYGARPVLAARAIEQHRARFLESLPLEEVQAIAQSEINLNALSSHALVELDTEQRMAMPQLSEAAELAIENIALEILDIECLELQRTRSRDYREIPVWDLWRALQAAYLAGMVDHRRNG